MFNHKEDKVVCERCGCKVEESLSVMMSDCSVVCVDCIMDDVEEDYDIISDDDY